MRLLGPVEIRVGTGVVRPSAAKVRTLLALLALHHDQALSAEVIADRLWAGDPPRSAASLVRTYVSELRRVLPGGPDRIERAGSGYLLRLGPDELDVDRFDSLAGAADDAGLSRREVAERLQRALQLWRGPPLTELGDDDLARGEVARLEERRWAVIEALAEAELGLGLHESVVARLEAAVHEAPLREHVVATLMVALYRCGRQAEALAAFQRLRRALADDLGLDPSPEIRQLESAILGQDPSLAAPGQPTGNVPPSLTSFVGRDAEIEELSGLIEHRRLVTVTGVGGCGKTRLALEVVRRMKHPDGVWFVELASCRSAVDVGAAVLNVLEIEQRPDEDAVSAMRRSLKGRHLLLVLDNCEQVAGECASLSNSILQAVPEAAVLATSRSALGSPGELVWSLEPLATPDEGDGPATSGAYPAARLFAERMSAARGGAPPRPDEWAAIGTLCRRLDGLPLAIELIAPKAATLSVTDLAEHMAADPVDGATAISGVEHQRSLSACVHWSLELLDAEHRRLLERVCLLPGWFTSAPAAAVAGYADDRDVRLGLGHLAGQSLLQTSHGARSRFRMLETVRQVVRTTVDDGDATDGLDALVAWAAEWCESVEPSLRGPEATELHRELSLQRDIIHAALEHGLSGADPEGAVRIAASVSATWAQSGHFVEGQRWLDRAVVAADDLAPALRMRLLIASGTNLMMLGDLDRSRRHIDAALSLARSSAGGGETLRTLLWAAHASLTGGDRDTSATLYAEALDLARHRQDSSSAASALAGMGDVAVESGDLEGGAALHLRSLAEFRAAGDRHGEGQALLNVADVDRRSQRFADADAGFEAAAATFAAIADRSCSAAALEGRAHVAFDSGRLDDAELLYLTAIDMRRELQQQHLTAADLVALARVLAAAARWGEAAAALGAAGEDSDPLAEWLRRELGDREYLRAWAEGSIDRLRPPT